MTVQLALQPVRRPVGHVHYGTALIWTDEPYESPSTGTVVPVCREPLCPWRDT